MRVCIALVSSDAVAVAAAAADDDLLSSSVVDYPLRVVLFSSSVYIVNIVSRVAVESVIVVA